MKTIRTTAQLIKALKDGYPLEHGEKYTRYDYCSRIIDESGNTVIGDTKLIKDLVVKCNELGLLD